MECPEYRPVSGLRRGFEVFAPTAIVIRGFGDQIKAIRLRIMATTVVRGLHQRPSGIKSVQFSGLVSVVRSIAATDQVCDNHVALGIR